jgi:hypothetical protein
MGSKLENIVINEGSTLTIEDRAIIENLVVDKGTLNMAQTNYENLELITIKGYVHLGSTLNSIDGVSTEINFDGASFRPSEGSPFAGSHGSFLFCWNLTLDPSSDLITTKNKVHSQASYNGDGEQCASDYLYFDSSATDLGSINPRGIFITDCEILWEGASIETSDNIIISSDLTQDKYVFNIARGIAPTNLPIYLAGSTEAKSADYKPDDLGSKVFPTIIGSEDTLYASSVEWDNNNAFIVLTRGAGPLDEQFHLFNVKDIYGIVCDTHGLDNKELIGKYAIWCKSFATACDVHTKRQADIHANLRGIIIGCDTESENVGNEILCSATLFGGYYETDAKYIDNNAKSKTGSIGGKLIFFNNDFRSSLLASCQIMNTKGDKFNIKNYILSTGMELAANFKLSEQIAIVPSFYTDYSLIQTDNFSAFYSTIFCKNVNRTSLCAGINLELGDENYGAHVGAHLNKRFGGELRGYTNNNARASMMKQASTYCEYVFGIHLRNKSWGAVSLEATHLAGGTKGFSVKLNLSVNI